MHKKYWDLRVHLVRRWCFLRYLLRSHPTHTPFLLWEFRSPLAKEAVLPKPHLYRGSDGSPGKPLPESDPVKFQIPLDGSVPANSVSAKPKSNATWGDLFCQASF